MLSPAPRTSSPATTGLRARADEAVINQWLLDQSTSTSTRVVRRSVRKRGDRPQQRFAAPRARTA